LLRVLTAFAVLASAAAAQESIDKAARRVLPSEVEMAWQQLDWRPTLWDAVVEAHEKKRPVLLWAMNGHPLGHT
jgi:hypothetical protein